MNKPANAQDLRLRHVKVLIAEDSEEDMSLVLLALKRGGFDPTHRRVQTAAGLETALARESWDAVLSDFNMPGFTGMDALKIFRSTGLDIPFILISGTIGEQTAVDAMKAGASDYIMKSSLARLAPALERELGETQMRAAHRQAQRDLVESERRLRTIFETEPECVKIVNREGALLEMNAAGLTMLEAGSLVEAQSRPLIEFIAPEHRAAFAALHKRVIGGESGILEFEVIGLRGGRRWLETHAAPLGGANAREAMLLGIARDITERKRASDELRESERRFSHLLKNVDLISVMLDRQARITYCNEYLLRLTGWRLEEVIGRDWFEVFVPPERGDMRPVFESMLANLPEAWHRDNQIMTRSGERRQIRWNNSVLRSGAGDVIGTASIGEDVTERKEAEAKIIRLNRVYAMLSGINSAIVRIRERDELFSEACRIAVSEGGFTLARVIDLDSNGKARIVTTCGSDSPLSRQIVDEYNDDPRHSTSVLGLALRDGQLMISNDVAGDVRIPNRAAQTRDGNYSIALLPIIVEQRVAGAIALRAREAGAFTGDEVRLLAELIGNLAFALEHIDKERELKHLALGRKLDEEALRNFSTAMDATADAIYLVDRASMRFVHVNEAACRMQSKTRAELLALGPEGVLSIPRDELMRTYDALIESGVPAKPLQLLRTRENGSQVWVELRRHALRSGNGWMIVTLARDVTESKAAERRIQRLNRVYAVLSGINALIVRVSDRDELFREACRIAVEQGGFKMAWIGMADRSAMKIVPIASAGAEPEFLTLITDRFSLREDAPMGNTMTARAVREKKAVVCNDIREAPRVQFLKERMERGIASMAVLPLLVADDAVGVLSLYADEIGFFDAEEMKLLTELAGDIAFAVDHIDKQARLDYLAYYDVLTGLANRRLFLERVAQHMRSAASDGRKVALFMIDLERFRNINDSLGRPAGDALLKQVADWLKRTLGGTDVVARMGGDHFAVVLPTVRQEGSVTRLLEKRMEEFRNHPFHLGDAVFWMAIKVGVALFPDDAADADTLMRNAEAALKKAKSCGDRYVLYQQKMTDKVAGKLTLENKLRLALDNEEYVLYYQPKISLQTGKITGAEALIRWNDPQTGLVPPGHFIPILEETGLIHDVGRWALRKAIADYLRWRAAGLPAVRIAVNVSPLQLRDRGFIAEVERAIGIDPLARHGLELEITESLIMEDVKHSIASLQAIREMKICVAIDDFGTGFSSLSYLAKLPVDTLKIDRSFVINMTTGPDGLSLVSTIINLAHALKLKVVAEGVETEEQSRLLRLLNCNEMQGFLFSKPVPAEMFETRFLVPAPTEVPT